MIIISNTFTCVFFISYSVTFFVPEYNPDAVSPAITPNNKFKGTVNPPKKYPKIEPKTIDAIGAYFVLVTYVLNIDTAAIIIGTKTVIVEIEV